MLLCSFGKSSVHGYKGSLKRFYALSCYGNSQEPMSIREDVAKYLPYFWSVKEVWPKVVIAVVEL